MLWSSQYKLTNRWCNIWKSSEIFQYQSSCIHKQAITLPNSYNSYKLWKKSQSLCRQKMEKTGEIINQKARIERSK